ncbi:hypothetical protein HYALB_00011721, partial [Hymenoscyphus albidus]
YTYGPVSEIDDEIRLLCRGDPALIDGQVKYTLHHVSLHENSDYEALSYTWADKNGKIDKEKRILIDDCIVNVGSNLAAALSQLFSGDVDRKLILESFKDKGLGATLYRSEGPWGFDIIPSPPVNQDIHAIVHLFRRGYWARSWIVQEVSFAKNITFYCGTSRMTWDDMKGVSDQFFKESPDLLRSLTSSSIGHVFYDLFSSGPNTVDHENHTEVDAPTGSIHEVITRYRTKPVFDPRDKVYSVRSLMAFEKQELIPIDYDLEVETLFKAVTILIVSIEKDLSILAENKTSVGQAFSVTVGEKVSHIHPSWVPEWLVTNIEDKIRVDRIGIAPGRTPEASGAGSIADCTIEREDILHMKAINIGKITQIGPLMHGRDDDEDGEIHFTAMFDILYHWWLTCHSLTNKNMFGANGFMDLLNFGQHGKQIAAYPELCAEHEKKMARYISILLALYKPNDDTYEPKLDIPLALISEEERHKAELSAWLVIQWYGKRKLIVYGDSNLGIGPRCVEVGDIIVVAPGCKVPVVLRASAKGDGNFVNIGDSYVEGMMEGRAIADVENGSRKFETFSLV